MQRFLFERHFTENGRESVSYQEKNFELSSKAMRYALEMLDEPCTLLVNVYRKYNLDWVHICQY